MIYQKFRSEVARHYRNIPGWRTNRKIIVFESDDWGSVRMPSKEVYQTCLKAGYPVDLNIYERLDTLESNQDLELLFELLTGFTDKEGNHPVITANCLVANPDFDSIVSSGFNEYRYESVKETFKKYPGRERGFELWMEGLNAGVFRMQFHGREHLNVEMFTEALRNGDPDIRFAVQQCMPGIMRRTGGDAGNYFVEATNYKTEKGKREVNKIIDEGLRSFADLTGYASESIIPTNYIWSPDFNETIFRHGVKFFQGYRKLSEPGINGNPKVVHTHYLGKRNSLGQLFLVRNGTFEPALLRGDSAVEGCLRDIAASFRMMKPAIISTHRINFVGGLEISNRENTLNQLKRLLETIVSVWPEAEFMSSDVLGHLIAEES